MSRKRGKLFKKPLLNEEEFVFTILKSDMTEEMQKESLQLCKEAWQEAGQSNNNNNNSTNNTNNNSSNNTTTAPTSSISSSNSASSTQLVQKDIAARIKKKFDSTYPNSTWHCIVGNHFASSITHQTKYSIFFQCNQQKILLFKTTE